MTDYKVEGGTYDAITVDLHRQNKNSQDGSSHRTYCSNYVQMTRTCSGRGLSLLQPVTLADLTAKPDKLLIAQLAKSTDIAWEQIESSPGF